MGQILTKSEGFGDMMVYTHVYHSLINDPQLVHSYTYCAVTR